MRPESWENGVDEAKKGKTPASSISPAFECSANSCSASESFYFRCRR